MFCIHFLFSMSQQVTSGIPVGMMPPIEQHHQHHVNESNVQQTAYQSQPQGTLEMQIPQLTDQNSVYNVCTN